ncbi:MAG: hypothetical protein EBR09_02555 [Proteobacteria bacterium]|nr:hypothetical protein [Pseudomonadota bacterium]
MWTASRKEIEFWKGISLIGLTCNHLFLWPLSVLSAGLTFTYQSFGWFTFASVYFASAGILWGRRAQSDCALWSWNLRRAAKLLLWVCAATAIFKAAESEGIIKAAPWQSHYDWSISPAIAGAAAGVQLPWLIDVIWLHAWFGIFATALWSLPWTKKQPRLTALMSVALWLADQSGHLKLPQQPALLPPWHSWASWQLLFVLSALSQNKNCRTYFESAIQGKRKILIACAVFAFILLKHSLGNSVAAGLTDTQKFAPLFAANSIAVLTLMNLSRKENLPDCLVRTGRYSLSGYSVQCVIVYGLGSNPLPFQNNPAAAVLILSAAVFVLLAFSYSEVIWRK